MSRTPIVHVRDEPAGRGRPQSARGDRVGDAGDGAARGSEAAGAGPAARARLAARAAATDPRGSGPRAVPRSARRAHLELVTYPAPEPDRERPVLFDDEVAVAPDGQRQDRRAARRRAAVGRVLARDPARRAGDPLRSRRARDDARRLRGASRAPTPLRRGDVRGDRAAAARRARRAAPRARRQGRPLGAQRAPPDRRAALRRDRPRAASRSSPTRSAVPART